MDRGAVDTLQGFLQRAHVLAAYRDGSASRARIADRAGCSRSTVYRAEQYLAEHGLIESTPDGYRLTGAGRSVVRQFERCYHVVEGAMHLSPLLSHAEPPELVDHLHLLADAEVIEQDPDQPYHIEHRMRTIISETQERMLGMTNGLGSPTLAETMIERIQSGVRVEWTMPSDTLEYFTAETGESAAFAVESEHTAVYVREDIPLDLTVYDDTLAVIGFDQARGVLAAVAITDEPAAVEWGRAVLAEGREAAQRVA